MINYLETQIVIWCFFIHLNILCLFSVWNSPLTMHTHTDKKENKISLSYIRKFRWNRVQSHIWRRASYYMMKCANISPYMRRPLVIYDFTPNPSEFPYLWRKILFSFYQCTHTHTLRVHIHLLQLLYTLREGGEWKWTGWGGGGGGPLGPLKAVRTTFKNNL